MILSNLFQYESRIDKNTPEKTYVIDKTIPIKEANKIVKDKFPNATIGRYPKRERYDNLGSLMFHDLYYYYQIFIEENHEN